MSQKFPVDNFEGIEDPSQFNEDFIKSYNEENGEGIFSKFMFSILKICIIFTMIYPFCLKK